MFSNIMIDLETLGKIPGHVIFACGYCYFNQTEILESGLIKIDIRESLRMKFLIDPATALWWKEKSRRELLLELLTNPDSVFNSCKILIKLLINCKNHWSWGTDFDYPILDAYFRAVNFSHNRFNLRDARTLVKMSEQSSLSDNDIIINEGILHNPLDDSIRQANKVQKAAQKFLINLE